MRLAAHAELLEHARRCTVAGVEAAAPLLELGFTCFGMRRIVGSTEARNLASARVLEKLGMRREAHFVENELVRGEWQSEFVYALREADWRRLRASSGA